MHVVYRLHGERHLHHRGQERSSQAYDNKLLSKIGKPKTPPATSILSSAETSPTSSLTFSRQPLPSQLRSLSFPNSVTSNYSDSPVKQEATGQYGEGSHSRPISPGTVPASGTAMKHTGGYRSPTFDSGNGRASTLSSELYQSHSHVRLPHIKDTVNQMPKSSRRSLGGSSLSEVPDESASLAGSTNHHHARHTHTQRHSHSKNTVSLPTRPVKRESYDHSIFSELEPTFQMEETVEQLHLDDRAHPPPAPSSRRELGHSQHIPPQSLRSSASMAGIKRKQMHSPPDPTQDAAHAQLLQQTANSASQYSQTASHLTANPFGPHHGSISSQSSTGFQNGSYTSSGGPSIGGASSYTSIDQHSPGGISPSDQSHQYPQQLQVDNPYNPALSLDPSTHPARSGPYPDPQQNLDPYSADASLPRKTNENPARRNNQPGMATNSNICACCPKKPKKFDTPEELR